MIYKIVGLVLILWVTMFVLGHVEFIFGKGFIWRYLYKLNHTFMISVSVIASYYLGLYLLLKRGVMRTMIFVHFENDEGITELTFCAQLEVIPRATEVIKYRTMNIATKEPETITGFVLRVDHFIDISEKEKAHFVNIYCQRIEEDE